MDFLGLLLWFIFSCTLIRCLHSKIRTRDSMSPRKLPPGPIACPVIGDLLKIGRNPHKSLAELAAKYGPLMTLRLGQKTTIVASSTAMAQQVLRHHDHSLSGRHPPDTVRAAGHDKFTIVFAPVSPRWRELRRICSSHIFDRKSLDAAKHLRRQKVEELVAFCAEMARAGAAVYIRHAAFITSLNILSNTLFSEDMTRLGSERAKEMMEQVLAVFEAIQAANIVDHFPFLRPIDPQGWRRRSEVAFNKLLAILDSVVVERLKSRNGPDSPSDRRDVLDKIIDINEEKKGGEETNIQHLFVELLAAGTDTTSVTVEWAIAELIRSPTVLSKARLEIEQAVGKGKAVEESDIAQLPYLQAVVKETLRLHPAGPLLAPHKAEVEVEVCGYRVPKNAQVLVNAWQLARDPTVWSNPHEFRPDRFLGSDFDVKGQHLDIIPFGSGRRICPGLPLAMRTVELTVASLIQHFDWRLEDGGIAEDMDMDDVFHIVLKKTVPLHVVPVLV